MCLFTRFPLRNSVYSMAQAFPQAQRTQSFTEEIPQYGIILLTFGASASLTRTLLRSFFLRFLAFEVRMWRKNACDRFTFPLPVFLKRLAAPLCVFSFGIQPRQLAIGS